MMEQKEAIRRTRELALQFPEGSEERAALRLTARAAELGKRISTSTLPAAASLVSAVGVARGILALVLDGIVDPIELRRAAREAFELLNRALAFAGERISSPPRAEPPESE